MLGGERKEKRYLFSLQCCKALVRSQRNSPPVTEKAFNTYFTCFYLSWQFMCVIGEAVNPIQTHWSPEFPSHFLNTPVWHWVHVSHFLCGRRGHFALIDQWWLTYSSIDAIFSWHRSCSSGCLVQLAFFTLIKETICFKELFLCYWTLKYLFSHVSVIDACGPFLALAQKEGIIPLNLTCKALIGSFVLPTWEKAISEQSTRSIWTTEKKI